MMLEKNRRFWDIKARENPYWYVSSFGSYGARNLDEFWASGQKIWRDIKGAVSYSPHKADTVIEIGCGVGRLTRAIALEVGQVHALDLSPEMIKLASSHVFSNVEFIISDGETLRPLADECADFVLAYCVFQHLPSLAVLRVNLCEMIRIAKPGAPIAFTLSPRPWYVHLFSVIRLRRRIIEALSSEGPRGLYRKEWLGIRPSIRQVQALSPIPLSFKELHGDKWFFYGKRPQASI